MENSLKYDPLHKFRYGDARAEAIDRLMSVKLETNLGEKIKGLFERHRVTEDYETLILLNAEIKNTMKDIEDIRAARKQSINKSKKDVQQKNFIR